MRIDLTPTQVKLLDTMLGLDLEAAGFTRAEQRTAHSIHLLLHPLPRPKSEPVDVAPRPIMAHEPLHVLRLTPSYRHSDK